MVNIIYIGKQGRYFKLLDDKIKVTPDPKSLLFLDSDEELLENVRKVIEVAPNLIIFDAIEEIEYVENFFQLIQYSQLVKKPYFLQLIQTRDDVITKGPLKLFNVLFYVKSQEVDDLLCLLSLFFFQKKKIEVAEAVFKDRLIVKSGMKISRIYVRGADIESNHLFNARSKYQIAFPLYREVFKYPSSELTGPFQNKISSPYKYRYYLNFKFLSDEMKHEERQKLIKEYNYMLKSSGINKQLYEGIEEVTKPKKISLVVNESKKSNNDEDDENSLNNVELMAKCFFRHQLGMDYVNQLYPHDFVAIYDSNYSLLKSGCELLKDEKIATFMHHQVIDADAELKRDQPTLIVVMLDEQNTIEKVSDLIKATTKIRDYFPYIVLFNYNGIAVEALRDQLEYHFIVAMPGAPREDVISRMVQIYRNKRIDKEQKRTQRILEELCKITPSARSLDTRFLHEYEVTKDLSDSKSFFFFEEKVELLAISEFELVFASNENYETGEIINLDIPVSMSLLVYQSQDNSSSSKGGKVYRGLIHFVSEEDKSSIRRFVNAVVKMNESSQSLTKEALEKMKKEYFSNWKEEASQTD